jgi:putative DNA methylase
VTPYRKKLIEVALPLEAINRESAREKSIRHGHPSTLHLWWARRPLAACRAVLFSSLVDDPDSDPTLGNWVGEDLEWRRGEKRQDLFDLIEQLVKWENSNNEDVIRSARAEIARCVASRKIETGELKKDQPLSHGITPWDLVVKGHVRPIRSGKDVVGFDTAFLPKAEAVNAFLAEHAPPVLDPFAGGGSIPLEAQRLGLRAFASDLNPVPVLINKALIEIPPKFAGRPPVNPEYQRLSKEEKSARTWPRMSASTGNGCATRPRNASATFIPR